MNKTAMVAVDAMGGDYAPHEILKGALSASRNNIPVCLFGPKQEMERFLTLLDPSWQGHPISLVHAPDVIAMEDEPVHAVRTKKHSSLMQAVSSVAAQENCALVSAGNTGALMAAATFVLGRMPDVERPAIAGFLPARHRSVFCLDLGANTDCKAHHLLQFAHMGSNYMQHMAGIMRPKVGLLSNGAEQGKGSRMVKQAYELLAASPLNFVGNVEPADVFNNTVDVVVSDGFSGNILLKSIESFSEVIYDWLRQKFEDETIAHGAAIIQSLSDRTDWKKQGGARLLGVCGTVIVVHGCARAMAIENAVTLAWKEAQVSHLVHSGAKKKLEDYKASVEYERV